MMKITTSELKQIIKEEAERFATLKALEVEKNKIEKQLNEMYEEADMHETMDETMDESMHETMDESMEECGVMEEEDAEVKANADEIPVNEGIMDFFKNPRDEKGAKALLKQDMEDVIEKSNAPDEVKDAARELIDTKIEQAKKYNYNAIPLLYQATGADRGAGRARAGKWYFSFKEGGPQTPIGKMLANLGAAAGAALRAENLEESKSVRQIAREEAEKVAKVNQLKEKAERIINEMKSL